MCITCRSRVSAGSLPMHGSDTSETREGWATDPLNIPISRAQLLKGAGAGLAAALAVGSLGVLQAAAPPLPYVVLIVLDGARREYFNISGIPHVKSLIRNGTQYTNAFAGILESETPSGHVSIATGSEPRANGVLSFSWAKDGARVNLFNPDTIRGGAMEKIIRGSHVPTLAGLIHATYPKAQVVALSGSKYYAADAIGGPDANVIMYFRGTANGQFAPTFIPGHAPAPGVLTAPGLTAGTSHLPLGVENHLVMQLAVDTFKKTRQQVTLINLPEFDWPLGHVDGGVLDPGGVKVLMQGFDRDLAMLQDAYRKARVLDHTLFVLLADHGMMPLRGKVNSPELSGAVARAGTSIVSQSHSSGSYIWVKDKSKAGLAGSNIAALHNANVQSVYVKTWAKGKFSYSRVSASQQLHTPSVEAANQYLLATFNGPNGPDVAVFFTEGVGSEPGGQASWKADHGGASWQAQHIPLILSGPGIRSGYVSPHPARLIDIAPTILQAMGASHRGMQGIPLADALSSPPPWTVQWQQAARKRLMPVVTALQQESRLELAHR